MMYIRVTLVSGCLSFKFFTYLYKPQVIYMICRKRTHVRVFVRLFKHASRYGIMLLCHSLTQNMESGFATKVERKVAAPTWRFPNSEG